MTKSTPLPKVSEKTLLLLEQSPLAEACRKAKLTSVDFSDITGTKRALKHHYDEVAKTPQKYHQVLEDWRHWYRVQKRLDRHFERDMKRLTRPERLEKHKRALQRKKEAKQQQVRVEADSRKASKVGPPPKKHHCYDVGQSPLEIAFRELPQNMVPITDEEHDRVHDKWRANGAPPYPPPEVMKKALLTFHKRNGTLRYYESILERERLYQQRLAADAEPPRSNPQLSRFGAQVPATAY